MVFVATRKWLELHMDHIHDTPFGFGNALWSCEKIMGPGGTLYCTVGNFGMLVTGEAMANLRCMALCRDILLPSR